MKWAYPLRIEEREGIPWVWDSIRKKWVKLTPEEQVRQQTIQYMIQERGVAAGLIGVEKGIRYNKMSKRFDIVVFDRGAQPLIICECKAPGVPLSQAVLEQVARYNASLKAPHILITNGLKWLFFSLEEKGKYVFQPSGWI